VKGGGGSFLIRGRSYPRFDASTTAAIRVVTMYVPIRLVVCCESNDLDVR